MGSGARPHLPTEIVVLIVEWVNSVGLYIHDEHGMSPARAKQKTLYDICLINHQWYSAAIRHLYAYPEFLAGTSFVKFAQTVSPPSRFNRSKTDLGSLVHGLRLDHLVHESSNSITSRLLGRVSKNLHHFTAPRASFGVNGLASLAKCRALIDLDLSLIGGKSITFPRLKKTVGGLPKLSRLILPNFLAITETSSADGQWPASLTHVVIGGHLDPHVMSGFDWPTNMIKLTISGCKNLDQLLLDKLLSNQQLAPLLELEILSDNQDINYDLGTPALWTLTSLRYLTIPVQLLPVLQIVDRIDTISLPPLPIRVLKLNGISYGFNIEDLGDELYNQVVMGCLENLWSLGASPVVIGLLGFDHDDPDIDNVIMNHVEEATDAELDSIGLDEVGFYKLKRLT